MSGDDFLKYIPKYVEYLYNYLHADNNIFLHPPHSHISLREVG